MQFVNGERGIRTLGTVLRFVQQISNLPLSTTQPSLQLSKNYDNRFPSQSLAVMNVLIKKERESLTSLQINWLSLKFVFSKPLKNCQRQTC